ncbi:unnamed protein product [Peniophora sp. CBMAI 1063]|nr:unnamed protein product [Peniophora sp. CBMAI 1063]
MSSVLRTATRVARPATFGARAFHSPFVVLADKAPAARSVAASASDYELEYASRTVYVVSEPELPATARATSVPMGAYHVSTPYSKETPATNKA